MSENANFFAALHSRFAACSSNVALETSDGTIFTYAQLQENVARYAGALQAQQLRPGDRITVQVEKTPQSLFLYLACLQTGVVYVPLNTAYRPAELAYFLGDEQPGVIVVSPEARNDILRIVESGRLDARVLTLSNDGRGSLPDAVDQAGALHEIASSDPDQVAVIIYTSGTTGRSKGAMLTHRNLRSNAETLVDYWAFNGTDVLLHALPIFHVHGLFVANHCTLLSGAKMLWHARFDARAVIGDLPRVTVMMGVPTYYTRLLSEDSFQRDTCANVRLFISGSAPLLAET